MPLNLGFFGMCLETMGNFYDGRRKQYFTLGDFRFLQIMRTRLKRYKQRDASREVARRFESKIVQDLQLLHALRNAFYGHSLLHKPEDRKKLANHLRKWFGRQLKSETFAKASFPIAKLEMAVGNAAPALYKLGLRSCRLCILMLLRFSRNLPFASHDFSIIGDMRVGEKLRHPPRPQWQREVEHR
jgi:hypothetical protein